MARQGRALRGCRCCGPSRRGPFRQGSDILIPRNEGEFNSDANRDKIPLTSMPLRWWNPTSGRVLPRELEPSAPGGRAPPPAPGGQTSLVSFHFRLPWVGFGESAGPRVILVMGSSFGHRPMACSRSFSRTFHHGVSPRLSRGRKRGVSRPRFRAAPSNEATRTLQNPPGGRFPPPQSRSEGIKNDSKESRFEVWGCNVRHEPAAHLAPAQQALVPLSMRHAWGRRVFYFHLTSMLILVGSGT